jgi:cold shock CspA family protein
VRGVVTSFDQHVGLGHIASDGTDYLFHCTQIANGSRTIAVGIEVHFTVRAGRLGRWEAAAVAPVAEA